MDYVGEEKPAGTQDIKAGSSLKQRGVTQESRVGEHCGSLSTSHLFAVSSPNHMVTTGSPPLSVMRSLTWKTAAWGCCSNKQTKEPKPGVCSDQVHDGLLICPRDST